MKKPAIVCAGCGTKDWCSVAPGDAPIYGPGGILVSAGKPAVAWCMRCSPSLSDDRPDRSEIAGT